jgi:xylulokinase
VPSVMGIDVGTTGVKVVLIGEGGTVIAEAGREHNLQSPRPGWAEENPAEWWTGVTEASRELMRTHDPRDVKAVGVSGMVPALVLLGARDEVLRPSIQQNDARATREIDAFRETYPEDDLFERTGATWNQQVIPPKLRWIQRHEPNVWRDTRRIAGSYEYITYRLSGTRYMEANWALESGMWDALEHAWLKPILELSGVTDEMLAPVTKSDEKVGEVTQAAADATGLAVGTPVIAGSADHVAAALAAGLTRPGEAVLKFGGAGDFLYVVDEFAPIRELFIDYHDIPGRFIINGCMATSGSLVKWFRDRFRPGVDYHDLDREAEAVPAGSDGLIVLPYFLGEKTPLHDPYARGTILGLTLADTPAHVYRAILEGVAYAFKHHVEVLEAAGHHIERFYVMDGGAKSALWREITASVLASEVHYVEGGHAGSAYGVAYVAGVASGLWDWETIRRWVRASTTTSPDPAAIPTYAELYAVYLETYRRLVDLYPRLEVADA